MTGPIKNNIPARNNELEHIKLRAEAESFGAFLKGEDEVVMKENLGILIDAPLFPTPNEKFWIEPVSW